MTLIDEITETRGRGNKECIGQGSANVVTGMFGGMGGCAMIGQSMINISSGGLGRMSGISAAAFLMIFILFASSLIEMIPLAALIGVMFIVVLGTFEWGSFRLIGKIPPADTFVGILVAVVTVLTDLAIAVIVGVIVSALVFAWQAARRMDAKVYDAEDGERVYELQGGLFFASIHNFGLLFDPAEDPERVRIDFRHTRVYDHSGIEAIDSVAERYRKLGKTIRLTRLSPECRALLEKSGDLVEVDMQTDPRYRVASDRLA